MQISVSKHTHPRAAAPEVMSSLSITFKADVYSFGLVMWELLTWRKPYDHLMSVQVGAGVVTAVQPGGGRGSHCCAARWGPG